MLLPAVTETLRHQARQLVDALEAMQEEDKQSLLKVLSVATRFDQDAVLLACTRWKAVVSKRSGIHTEMLDRVANPMVAMRKTDAFLRGEKADALFPEITESLKREARLLADALQAMDDKRSLLGVLAVTTQFPPDAVLLACTRWKRAVSERSGVDVELLTQIANPMVAMRKTAAVLEEETEEQVTTTHLFAPDSLEAELYEKLSAEHSSSVGSQGKKHTRQFVTLMFQALQRMDAPTLPSILSIAGWFPDDIARLALVDGKARVMREAQVDKETVEKAQEFLLADNLDRRAQIIEDDMELNPDICNAESMVRALEAYPKDAVYALITRRWSRSAPTYIKNIFGFQAALRTMARAISDDGEC